MGVKLGIISRKVCTWTVMFEKMILRAMFGSKKEEVTD
jgi:hypothetical protein